MQELALTPLTFASALAAQYIMDFIDRHVVGRYFDWKHNVDTAASADDRKRDIRSRNGARGNPYMATPARTLRSILAALRTDLSDFVFIDVGSGKGRAMLVAAEFPFRRILGIEFARDLISVAIDNVRRYRNRRQRCRAILPICIDAENFTIPDRPCVFYLFNPFDRELTRAFVARAASAFGRYRNKMYFILYHPRHEVVFESQPYFRRVSMTRANTDVYAVYESIDPSRQGTAPA